MSAQIFGPLSVSPEQVGALGTTFAPFVDRLLDIETASAGLAGASLTTTYRQNVPDGGVDASIRNARRTRWIPEGNSAWQFKSGDLDPKKCRKELRGARHALEILRHGGAYRLVLGTSLTPLKLANRRKALREEIDALGITRGEDTVEVLDGAQVARWAEDHPSLAVSPLLGGLGHAFLDFPTWSGSGRHPTAWISSQSTEDVRAAVSEVMSGGDRLDLRIEAVSGAGKSRSVMEAIRGQPFESLVIYLVVEDMLDPGMVHQLLAQRRAAVLIVDDCSARKHEALATMLQRGSPVRLITIGEPGDYLTRGAVLQLGRFDDESMDSLLATNHPNLWIEARRPVVEAAAGNIKLALLLAERIVSEPSISTADWITGDVLRQFVTGALPGGVDFLACSALALFTRIGYDGELAAELELVADGLSVSTQELRAAARALDEAGLLAVAGRYRSVSPHPVAVYLAARGWEEFGDLVVRSLLPNLTESLARRLLTRAADIGGAQAVKTAVLRILDDDGPFANLTVIADRGYGPLLSSLAIVAPDELSDRLGTLIGSSTLDDLRERYAPLRRDLVWSLEKLAWHTRTFDEAADALLRLAEAESETWGNNATGTWLELFGLRLPATAASPDLRLNYLARTAATEAAAARKLVVAAGKRALSIHESVMVSGELQGGMVVEPRGFPRSWDEAWAYQRGVITILRHLANDPDRAVATEAVDALVGAIHPILEQAAIRDDLFSALSTLDSEGLKSVRSSIAGLRQLFRHAPDDTAERSSALEILAALLPAPTVDEELETLARARSWAYDDGELETQFTAALARLPQDQRGGALLRVLGKDVSASFEIGRLLAAQLPNGEASRDLIELTNRQHKPAPLAGYLWGLVDRGDPEAFDRFLDGPEASALEPRLRVSITVRGPKSEAGWHRVDAIASGWPVVDAASSLFGWHASLEPERLTGLLHSWGGRLAAQADYNASIDFAAMAVFQRPEWVDGLDDEIWALVTRRPEFPSTGQQTWDWTQLAARSVERRSVQLVELLLASLSSIHLIEGTPDGNLFRTVLSHSGEPGWELLTARLADGDWRLAMHTRGWMPDIFSADMVTGWIADDLERARLVASVAGAGADAPTPISRFLLSRFGDDERIQSSLAGEFLSGSWVGKESDRLRAQIAQLSGWIASDEPAGVKRWAAAMIDVLKKRKESATQREAEDDFYS